ncbi:MAG: sialate O-acetylesterase [Flavobacteriaceae bacterium]|nr:MAG: sialate O-acetylesterase [Flavobacteriaceae bacterium]
MNIPKTTLSFFLVLLCFTSIITSQTKVACVGDSVTWGFKIKDRAENSYPVQLQELLGPDYAVKNFGHSGATALRNGHKPYVEKPAYQNSLDFLPNIVIIHLGLNDQGLNNWPQHKEEFIADYLELIHSYQQLKSTPKVIICQMTPSLSGHHWFEEGMRESYQEIQLKIKEISVLAEVDIIDLQHSLERFPEYYSDDLHPDKNGAKIIAQKSYGAITGDYGGLKLGLLFGENMVLQRNQPIVISGTANAAETLTIRFNNIKKNAIVATDGTWKVTFPAMKAGGPFKLKIQTTTSKEIILNKVYIGEVWLASGQSNMAFSTKRMEHATTVLQDSMNPNIHLIAFTPQPNKGRVFSLKKLATCNADDFFKTNGWQQANRNNISEFSAIAYSYAYHLQKSLGVPVGIICNAVGGSPTQSWISRKTMETSHPTVDLLNDTYFHPMVQPWLSERKTENFKKLKSTGLKARHPFDPTFLYDAGISPLQHFNIAGVIWYQGESNAERPQFHSLLFKQLVTDWRTTWNKPKMPFYFVQLSSLNRPTWGQFRAAQNRLQSIPNTGMAVSSDLGHPTDVHPTKKWEIGRRLSLISLAKNYSKKMEFFGPTLDYINVKKNTLVVHFTHANGLQTINNAPLTDIQIAGNDLKFKPAMAKIKGNTLILSVKQLKNPRFVKYGYEPYTTGNLINKAGLPASTFSNLNL